MLRKISSSVGKGVVVLSLGAVSSSALAASGSRVLESQGNYLGGAANIWTTTALAVMFIAGLLAIGAAAWFFLQDYVFAKSDHEKSFSIGKLITGAVVGSFLCYPGGAAILGQDVTVGPETTIDQGDFTRDSAG